MKIVVKAGADVHRFEAKKGDNLLNALLKNGVVLPHPCHGRGKCAKCRVIISSLDAQGSSESSQKKVVNRLACLTEIREPLMVSFGAKGNIKKSKTGGTQEVKPAKPAKQVKQVKQVKPKLNVTPPSKRKSVMIRACSPSDLSLWERLAGAFDGKDLKALEHGMESVLPGLRDLISEEGGPVTLVRSGSRLFGLYRGEQNRNRYGIAFHFQAGQLSGVLVDFSTGRTDWFVTLPFHGAGREAHVDVMNRVVEDLCDKAGCMPADVTDVVVAARIPVVELLAGMRDETGGMPDILPVVLTARLIGSERIGLDVAPYAVVYLPPAGSAAYGPDLVMASLAGDANPTGVMAGALACLMDAGSRKTAEKRG